MPNDKTINPNAPTTPKPGFHERQPSIGKKPTTQDDFMKLFLTQMRTQNPMKPLDSGAMMQQMSQMASLSATQQLEKSVKSLNDNMGKTQMMQATQIIGKKAQVFKSISPLVKGEGLSGAVFLEKPTTGVTVTIKDPNNNIVNTIQLPASGEGIADFEWDGKDLENKPCEPGYYRISATAVIDGKSQEIKTLGNFKVNSVGLDREQHEVILNLEMLGGTSTDKVVKILNPKESRPWA